MWLVSCIKNLVSICVCKTINIFDIFLKVRYGKNHENYNSEKKSQKLKLTKKH